MRREREQEALELRKGAEKQSISDFLFELKKVA